MRSIKDGWDSLAARRGKMRNECRVSVGKPEGNGSFGRPRRRWVAIESDFRGIKLEGVDIIHVD
jgi:hypothetical protein